MNPSVLIEWLGAGGQPVPQQLAERRSIPCLDCLKNRAPRWWESAVGMIADSIRRHIAEKHKTGLKVSRESELHMCAVCGCCIPLKVWTPIEHIKHHTTPEQLKEFPAHCWIKKEIAP